ncbi:unnamed protein product, partial [Brassica rapa]
WAKITQTVHGKGQHAESKDQRADMCTDGQPRTSSTDVLCVLTDTHGRPVCADRQPITSCPTWAKITQTVHGKGQRAESRDQHTDGHTQTATDILCVLADTHERPVYVLCVLTETHGQPRTSFVQNHPNIHEKGQRAESKDQHADMYTDGEPQTSCVF